MSSTRTGCCPIRVRVGRQRDHVLDVDGHNLDRLLLQIGDEQRASVRDEQVGAGRVDGLAQVLVLEDVSFGAGADVGRLFIPAHLRAGAGHLALVQVHAHLRVVGHEHLPRRTRAQRAGRSLLAAVGARSTVTVAILQVATGTFVRPARAIAFSVANLNSKPSCVKSKSV